MRAITAIVIGLVALVAVPAHAAQIVIINADQPGLGLNDPTPVAPVPGNPGTTLGQQRMNVIVEAATRWGRQLVSNVPIRLQVQFQDMQCDDTWIQFGYGGPGWLSYDFANAPLPGTWYTSAQASALRGLDMAPPEVAHVRLWLNPLLDSGCMGPDSGWSYVLERSQIPTGRILMLTLAVHEMAHGLGVYTQIGQDGQQSTGRPDVWNHFSFDFEQNRLWPAMTDSQRAASMINDPDLVWVGERANEQVQRYLQRPGQVTVTTPAAIAGNYVARPGAIGERLPASGITGQVVASVPATACSPLTNATAMAGRIALIDRGDCLFTEKVAHAGAAGAIAVIIADNAVNTNPMSMAGTDPNARIPSHAVHKATGDAIRAHLGVGVTVRLGWDMSAPITGTRNDTLRLHAPNPYSGAALGHLPSASWPPLLMVPSISPSIFGDLDLTPALLRDIGWPIDPIFDSGFGGRLE